LLEESYDFQSRHEFKTEFEEFPDAFGIAQVEVKRARTGELVSGLARVRDEAHPATWTPTTLKVTTELVIVHQTPIMTEAEHHFKEQGMLVFKHQCAVGSLSFGQLPGAKYAPKKKPIPAYTRKEIEDIVGVKCNQKRERESDSSFLQRITGSAGLNDINDVRTGSVRRDSKSDDAGANQFDVAEHASVQGDGALGSTSRRLELMATVAPADVRGSPGSSSVPQRRDAGAPTLALRDSGAAPGGLTASADSTDLALIGDGLGVEFAENIHDTASILDWDAACDNDRVKPPAYWMQILTADNVFRGKNFTKQMKCATACVKRVMATDSVQVAFPNVYG
jgi:hypothetical protein